VAVLQWLPNPDHIVRLRRCLPEFSSSRQAVLPARRFIPALVRPVFLVEVEVTAASPPEKGGPVLHAPRPSGTVIDLADGPPNYAAHRLFTPSATPHSRGPVHPTSSMSAPNVLAVLVAPAPESMTVTNPCAIATITSAFSTGNPSRCCIGVPGCGVVSTRS